MKVNFSPAADADLESIGDYIALDNPTRAHKFIAEVKARCALIGENPQAAPVRDELAADLRMVVFRRYLIFYTEQPSEIRIERVLHGTRDLKALF